MHRKYLEDYAASWKNSKPAFPFLGRQFTLSEKQTREIILDQYIESVEALRKGKTRRGKLTPKKEQLLFAGTKRFFRDGLNFTDQQLGMIFSDKLFFSKKFHLRLDGQAPEPGSAAERKIFSMVAMIETEFPRSDYPEVYASLIDIHKAQTRSLRLFHSGSSLSEPEILEICLAKGGASVEDRAAGVHTIFSGSDDFLETKLNRTYWFGERVMQNLGLFGVQHLEVYTSLMRQSMDLLVIEAIAQNPSSYSKEYSSAIEDYSLFSFACIQSRKKQFASHNGFLRTALGEE